MLMHERKTWTIGDVAVETNCLFLSFQKEGVDNSSELKREKKVHLGRTMHCLPRRLKSTFFEKFLSGAAPKGPAE